jgi:crotonobetainyl-CoA:carnitine CoA-transferase CaiB-like acyl-CoA transferase
MEQALDPVTLAERQMLADYDHPGLGRVRSVGLPVAVGGYAPEYKRGPRLGENMAVLEALGYSSAQIGALAERGAFGSRIRRVTPPN